MFTRTSDMGGGTEFILIEGGSTDDTFETKKREIENNPAIQNLEIVDLPIRYRDRHNDETNISRWRQGVILLRMVMFAASKIKFY